MQIKATVFLWKLFNNVNAKYFSSSIISSHPFEFPYSNCASMNLPKTRNLASKPITTRLVRFKSKEHEDTKPSKYVVEKSCDPSIFDRWKPKVPELNYCVYPKPQDTYKCRKYRKCIPGMKFQEKSKSDIEREARQCLNDVNPTIVKECYRIIGKQGQEPIPPPLLTRLVRRASKPDKQSERTATWYGAGVSTKQIDHEIPEGDWDSDRTL
ncbi:uncharacterized protein LOC132703063 [Cylas formicarius]|uniref:uncharacterized protein LOC132703063 n=1 Tax=Cylas formicarius TaxID=197179 RepID=UPI002958DC2B|nr:uncharacterized protein LOC132703063 [Cylas formicarius]